MSLYIYQGEFWSRNDHGIWCNVCGDLMKAPHQFETLNQFWEHEPSDCRVCGAPDEIDPEAI